MSVVVIMVMCGMAMFVRMCATVPVGSAFRCEGLCDFGQLSTEMFEHMCDNRVVLDQQAASFDLARSVTVSNVPCKFRQVSAGNRQQVFRGSDDFDLASIGEFEGIAVVHRCRVLEIDKETLTCIGL